MRRLLLMAGGLVLFALLIVFCVQTHVSEIEDDLSSRARAVLQKAGFRQVVVSMDGRDLKLGGIVPSEAFKHRAEQLAFDVQGIVNVSNQMLVLEADNTVPALPQAYQTGINLSAGQLTFSGSVPDRQARASLLLIAARLFGKGKIIDQLVIRPGAPDHWQKAAEQVLLQLQAFDEASVQIIDTQIHLSGVASNPTLITHVQTNNANTFPANFQSTYDISVADTATEHQDQHGLADPLSCREQFTHFLSRQMLHFKRNSDSIDRDHRDFLAQLIERLQSCQSVKLEIGGYTDSQGSQTYNRKLAKQRAEMIASYLQARGIASERLTTVGYGELSPVASNATEQGRAENRRIEFNVMEE